jgi:hypothetical protein
VLLAKRDRYCVIVDDVVGAGEHRVDLRFQLAPMPVAMSAGSWVRVGTESGLLIQAFSSVSLKPMVKEGEIEPRRGWHSPDYGYRAPAPVLIYSAVGPLPVRIVTLLLPWEALETPPHVGLVTTDRMPTGLTFDHGPNAVHFDSPVAGWSKP